MTAQGELLLLLAVHLTLTGLPGVAAALFAARSGVRQVPVLLAIGLAATGAAAMLAFWAYYADRPVGETFSYLVLLGSALLTGWLLYERRIPAALLRELAVPLSLWALGSAFLVFLGFLHGGTDGALATSSTRFGHLVVIDNYIPQYFGEWFFENGHDGTQAPLGGEWLSSDRPPLQMGFLVLQRAIAWDGNGLHYQVFGVVLQQLWIVGLWALLLAARVGRLTRALTMLTVLISGLAIVNGFFIWPKMLPTAMLLGAAALVLTPLWAELRTSLRGACLIALLIALGLLGHGASAFGVIALALVAALRGLPSWRWIGTALLVGALATAPWAAYQKYGDPPGNRLTKWMLAGVDQIDTRGTREAIVDSYREAGFGGALHKKGQNFVTIVGGGPFVDELEVAADGALAGDLALFVKSVRSVLFVHLLPSLGLLLIGLVAMAIAWRRGPPAGAEWSLAVACLGLFVVGAMVWGLILFGPPSALATLHVGSYLIPAIGLCGAAVGLRAAFPRFAVGFLAVNAVLMLALYTPSIEPPEGTAYSPIAALLALAGLAGFLGVALRAAPPSAAPRPLPDPVPAGSARSAQQAGR